MKGLTCLAKKLVFYLADNKVAHSSLNELNGIQWLLSLGKKSQKVRNMWTKPYRDYTTRTFHNKEKREVYLLLFIIKERERESINPWTM